MNEIYLLVESVQLGARGYLLKDADKEEVVRAIVAVERGEAIFSPAIAQRMMKYFSAPSSASNQKGQPSEFAELTEREFEILDLIAQGDNNAVIANKLSLSIKTVQNYVSNILNKLQAADRPQAIAAPGKRGCISNSPRYKPSRIRSFVKRCRQRKVTDILKVSEKKKAAEKYLRRY